MALFLFGIIPSSLQVPSCAKVPLTSQKILKRLRRNFMFVEKPSASPQPSVGIPRRSTREVTLQLQGYSKCPWSWAQDDNPNRFPRFLTKAVCPNCKHFCRAVRYSHRGLVQKCDVRTGEVVWKWAVVELPVAFLFDPWGPLAWICGCWFRCEIIRTSEIKPKEIWILNMRFMRSDLIKT